MLRRTQIAFRKRNEQPVPVDALYPSLPLFTRLLLTMIMQKMDFYIVAQHADGIGRVRTDGVRNGRVKTSRSGRGGTGTYGRSGGNPARGISSSGVISS